MSTKVADFISKLVMHYPVRFESEERETEWIGSMAAAFKSYNSDVLQRAAQKIIDTRTDRRFPLVAEIHKVCTSIIYDDGLKQQSLSVNPSPEKASVYSESREKWADTLVMGEMGRQAAKEGWILTLHDYARQHGRLPEPAGIGKLKAQARGFDDALEQCRAGGFQMAVHLRELGTSMLARRQALADMVLHGVVR